MEYDVNVVRNAPALLYVAHALVMPLPETAPIS